VSDNGRDSGAVALRGLVKQYGTTRALDDVSLEVAPGEFVTFLGPSGSGKTTTLKIVAGFTATDAGEVRLDGRDITGVPPYKRDIGMVFQNYALFPHMTAAQNLTFPLQMRKVDPREAAARVSEALELVQLGSFGDRYPSQMSGGQQQRVALARAIVFRPRLLLMDEPLGALDKKLREALQLEIRRISHALGVTVIYVTHDQEEALVISDRIAIYNRGRIEQIGTGEDLYEAPVSYFVADFMGESNIFRGRLRSRPGDGRLEHPAGELAVSAEALGRANLSHGSRAALVVRPERLEVATTAPPSDGAPRNSVRATVTERIYLGSVRKYELRTADGTTLRARLPMSEPTDALAPGQEVEVRWRVSDGVVVADTGGEARGRLDDLDPEADRPAPAPAAAR
jgi:putative spermidine/putrescine transport system ATP-binding protein